MAKHDRVEILFRLSNKEFFPTSEKEFDKDDYVTVMEAPVADCGEGFSMYRMLIKPHLEEVTSDCGQKVVTWTNRPLQRMDLVNFRYPGRRLPVTVIIADINKDQKLISNYPPARAVLIGDTNMVQLTSKLFWETIAR